VKRPVNRGGTQVFKVGEHELRVQFPAGVSEKRVQGILNRAPPGKSKLTTVTRALAKVGAAFVPWDDGKPGDGGAYNRPAASKKKVAKKTGTKKGTARKSATKKTASEAPAPPKRARKPRTPKPPASASRTSARANTRAEEAPRTSRSSLRVDDAAVLKEPEEQLKAEGQGADFPDLRHVWLNGGRDAVTAWKHLHKIETWAEAMEQWIAQHPDKVREILALPRAA
jgi:hypothetical protein